MSKQEKWRVVAVDDSSCVFVDDNGSDNSVMEVVEDLPIGKTLYRFNIDRLTTYQGCLVTCHIAALAQDPKGLPHPIEKYNEWFFDSLEKVGTFVSLELAEIVALLCHEDPIQRSIAYRAIGDYHGFLNLDHYPENVRTWKRTLGKSKAKQA